MNNENNHDDDDNDNDRDHDDDDESFLRPMPFDTLHVRHFVCDDIFCGAYSTTRVFLYRDCCAVCKKKTIFWQNFQNILTFHHQARIVK